MANVSQFALHQYNKKVQEEQLEVAKSVADSLARKTLEFVNKKARELVDKKVQRIIERRRKINQWMPIFKLSEYTGFVENKILNSSEYLDIWQAYQPFKTSANRILDIVEQSQAESANVTVSKCDWQKICQFCRTELSPKSQPQSQSIQDTWK